MQISSEYRLRTDDVTLGYGDRIIAKNLDIQIKSGAITTVIGPNGCGKSTLLRSLGRLVTPQQGHVLLDGNIITRMKTREVAKMLGILPQSPVSPDGLTVSELVRRGRSPHQSWMKQWSVDDEAQVAEALRLTDISDLADIQLDRLSGGQRQRAWIAMALAQGTDILLLDEPTTYLDLAHAVGVLDLIDILHSELDRTIVMVLHDLNLAIRYSDVLIVMSHGQIVASGAPKEIVTADLLYKVFNLSAKVIDDPVSDGLLIVPIGARHVFGAVGDSKYMSSF
ncbi:MAG: ABC transporter ATP-binding protein [Mycobacteriaceae bacterium]